MSALPPKADIRGCSFEWPLSAKSGHPLCGSFDPSIDFAAKHPEINWLGEKRFGTGLQGVAFCFCIAVGGNHDDRDVGSSLPIADISQVLL